MLGHITAVPLAPEAIPVKIWARFYYMYFWAALSHTQGKGLYKLHRKNSDQSHGPLRQNTMYTEAGMKTASLLQMAV